MACRFLAAFAVFFAHHEQAKTWLGILGFPIHRAGDLAQDGVTLFFVLSGFLITYLLFTEQKKTGTIQVKKFYTRRMLKIWPLYYFFTFLTFFVFPYISFLTFPNLDMAVTRGYWQNLGLFMLMSPHISAITYGCPGVAGPLWSVGAEEYFYLFWPHVLKYSKRFFPLVLLIVIFLPILLRHEGPPFNGGGIFRGFFYYARFDCMAIGGMGAWIYLNKRKWLNYIFGWPIQLIIYYIAIKHLRYGPRYGEFTVTVYSLVYIGIILNVALNPRTILRLENRVFRFLGEISYGLYVYQWLANVICLNLYLMTGGIENYTLRNWVLLTADFAITVGMATASYYLLEKRFLRMKKNYAPIVAGANALPANNAI